MDASEVVPRRVLAWLYPLTASIVLLPALAAPPARGCFDVAAEASGGAFAGVALLLVVGGVAVSAVLALVLGVEGSSLGAPVALSLTGLALAAVVCLVLAVPMLLVTPWLLAALLPQPGVVFGLVAVSACVSVVLGVTAPDADDTDGKRARWCLVAAFAFGGLAVVGGGFAFAGVAGPGPLWC